MVEEKHLSLAEIKDLLDKEKTSRPSGIEKPIRPRKLTSASGR